MGKRTMEIVLTSAESLTRQHPWHPMVVSAGAYITNGTSRTTPMQYTIRDYARDVNPKWNQAFYFTLEYSFGTSREFLNIELYNTTPDGMWTFCFGLVQIPVNNFITSSGRQATSRLSANYPVSTGGILRLSYKLGPYITIESAIFGNPTVSILTGLITSVAGGLITHEINNQLDDNHNDYDNDRDYNNDNENDDNSN